MTEAGRPRSLIAGNWKMNGTTASLAEAMAVADAVRREAGVDVLICPPATLVMAMAEKLKRCSVAVGGQDCHAVKSGAYTGDVSAEMLKDAGASAVILGHSERRSLHGESDAAVAAKAVAAIAAGLKAIVCVGETAGQRKVGLTLDVVGRQVEGSLPKDAPAESIVIAYEPVWAIGTGLVPSNADVAEVHAAIRSMLEARFGGAGRAIPILYGGSVKPDNAAELLALPNVDGALVGGASLKAADFLGIIAKVPTSGAA
jgi:triosephosphate isomerase